MIELLIKFLLPLHAPSLIISSSQINLRGVESKCQIGSLSRNISSKKAESPKVI
jgi:hypothetical protein